MACQHERANQVHTLTTWQTTTLIMDDPRPAFEDFCSLYVAEYSSLQSQMIMSQIFMDHLQSSREMSVPQQLLPILQD